MCFVLYAGTVSALPRVAWNKEAPDLSVESLTERDAAIKQYFTNPEVQYVGSTSGCGCDFPNVMLQNGEWPRIYVPEAEKDEFDKKQDISDQHNRKLLVNLLRAPDNRTVELYGIWIGGKDDMKKSPQAFEDISLGRILGSDFRFKEQVLYRVHIESGPIPLVR
jgi:hypothetical protein